jgi:hypothetical protein
MPLVVAVVGKRFAGISTVLHHLGDRHGYDVYTLGAELRSVAQERGVSLTSRRNLQYLGDEVRSASGDTGYLARRVLRRIRRDRLLTEPTGVRPIAVGGLKHVGELEAFRCIKSFRVMIVEADDAAAEDPSRDRYMRALNNGLLEEEYAADRERWLARGDGPRLLWDEMSADTRRTYFNLLDTIHTEGHRSRYATEYRGQPARVINAVREDAVPLDNAHGSIVALHTGVAKALAQLRPAHQIIRQ